jgi:hypothetical protein
MATEIIEIRASIDDKAPQTFVGRFAWTLNELIGAGEKGVTPLERPAPRWSHYVFRLRREGVAIETITEAHAGAYSGSHARYVLRSKATVLATRRAGEGHSHAA